MADYKRRMGSENVEIASSGGGRSRNLFQMLFGGGGDEDESPDAIASDEAPAKPSKPSKPAAPQVQVASAQPAPEAAPQPKQTFIENIPSAPGLENAPVPAVRPTLAAQQPDLQTALVSPARSAATDAMASVLQPPQDDGEQYADLGQYKIPVPDLLADRKLPGEADTTAVPLPDSRPSFEVASANADGGQDGGSLTQPEYVQVSGGDEQSRRQDEIAAMIRRMSPDVVDGKSAPASVTPASRPKQQVAMAMPAAPGGAPQPAKTLKANIRPALSAKGYEAKKGARPNKMDAIAALRGSRGEPNRLTGELLEKWALAANHSSAIMPKPVEAVARQADDVVARPEKVSTGEVAVKPAKFDTSRFYATSPTPGRAQ